MALDSSGNQAIDFVWGNNPLKPDADRAENIADITAGVYGASADVPSGGNQSFYVSNIVGINVGDTIEVTGALPYSLNTSYVVEAIYPASPNGGSLVTTTPNGISGAWETTVTPTLSKSASGNFGGGLGDTGWSKTTKVKSVKLDPALDGHNIATEYWNNFPDYTPNAGFIPQELWSHSFGTNSGVTVSPDWREAFFNSYPSGYVVSLSLGVIQDTAKYDDILSYIASDAVIGKSTNAFTLNMTDSYGQPFTVNLPEGHIVGSDTSNDMYGGLNATLTVYTGTITTSSPSQWDSSRPVSNAFDFVIGAGVNKTLIYKGVVGTDFTQTYESTTSEYGDISQYLTLQQMNTSMPLSPATLALEAMNLTGAIAGYGNISPFDMYGYNVARVTFPIVDADFTYSTDFYGSQLTNVRLIGVENAVFGGNPLYEYNTGTVLYIVK